MDLRHRRRELHGVVGGAGVVAALAGVLGVVAPATGVLLAFAIWIVGATLVNVFTDRGRPPPGSRGR